MTDPSASESAAASPELVEVFEDIRNLTGGEPSNFFQAMAARPDLVKSIWGMTRAIFAEGTLPPSLTQMIALKISEDADCRYCRVFHRRVLQDLGIDDQTVTRHLDETGDSTLPVLHRRVLRFAGKAARDARAVSDADVGELRQSGLSEGELLEVALAISFTRLLNTFADAARVPLDEPSGATS